VRSTIQGTEAAITAGLDFAPGDAVAVMHADLPDPPEVLPEMAARRREGFDVVCGVRREPPGERRVKRVTAAFCRFLQRMTDVDIPLDTGEFRLVDREMHSRLAPMREGARFVRGMFSWGGFKPTGVVYDRAERIAGETKFPRARCSSSP
jgi:dolichol-phosphate mannosyltransferase